MVHCQDDICDYCGCCVAVCPTDAIELKISSLHIDDALCTLCLSCVHVCPFGALEVVE